MARIRMAACAAAALSASAAAGLPPYSLIGSYTPDTLGLWDLDAQGRILTLDGSMILRQLAPNSTGFETLGSIDSSLISPFGASFISASPTGDRVAIGDGNFGPGASVHFVELASASRGMLAVQSVGTPNYEAHWAADGSLFVTGAETESVVTRIDTMTLTASTVISNIGGGSGGVTTDGAYLYTSNGFDFDPTSGSETGEVRAFALGDLAFRGAPLDFESEGISVARALSGGSLGFDDAGNLLIGGGDFFGGSGDFGYAAVVDNEAIASALLGFGPAMDADELRLGPAGDALYTIRFNDATGELLVGADGVIYRYAIPAPAASLTLMGAAMLTAGRRRRDAR